MKFSKHNFSDDSISGLVGFMRLIRFDKVQDLGVEKSRNLMLDVTDINKEVRNDYEVERSLLQKYIHIFDQTIYRRLIYQRTLYT